MEKDDEGLTAQATGLSPALRAQEEWRCFHCYEVFTSRISAREHFGAHEGMDAACVIKLGAERSLLTALRRAEADAMAAWNMIHNESTEAAKAYHAQHARHSEQLRCAEELGYERGLADGMKLNQPRGLSAVEGASPEDVNKSPPPHELPDPDR